jgi:hypothetical protein
MIPLPSWLTATAAKALALAVLLAIVGALIALSQCHKAQTAGVTADLATKQAGAAIQSGADSVATTSNVQAATDARQTTVKEATDAIDQAPGGNSNDAALRASCKLRSYRHSKQCIALLGIVAP